MTKRKRPLVFSLYFIALAVWAIGWGWFLFRDTIHERWNRQRFDSATWQSAQSRTNAVRIRMVDDLLRQNKFRGMSRDKVTAIIGEPDQTDYFREWDLVYWLGPERGMFSIDSEWLVFRLDDQKKVSNYQIVSD